MTLPGLFASVERAESQAPLLLALVAPSPCRSLTPQETKAPAHENAPERWRRPAATPSMSSERHRAGI
jgi:hypothetical protein